MGADFAGYGPTVNRRYVMWPFKRASPTSLSLSDSYTDRALDAQMADAARIRQTAVGALEHAAGLTGRALAAATVEGTSLLLPSTMRDIGRDLILTGESYCLFDIGRDLRATLTRASWATVYGGYDPATWKYDIYLPGPSTTTTRRVTRSVVIHPRYATEPSQPWRGIAPLRQAVLTGQLAASLEASLGREAKIPVKSVYLQPTGYPDKKISDVLRVLKSDKVIATLETTRQAGGLGQSAAPNQDWHPIRQGPDIPAGNVTLYSAVYSAVLGACGVPPALSGMQGSTGGALLREGIRIFESHTLRPIVSYIEEEASRVLETPITITLHRLSSADMRGKAQTLKLLMDSPVSMAKAEAMRLVGLS